MSDYELLIDLHQSAARQGPGGDAETELALNLAQIDRTAPLTVADIGCGTGASTLVLAKHLNAHITAVDFLQDFLDVLEARAKGQDLSENISPVACSMANLPFEDETLDVIWSEGAIYNIGFTQGIKTWKRFLKPGGLLVVSEITWITGSRPAEIQTYWEQEYPEIDMASRKIRMLEENGYALAAYFVLPERCWLENYYEPMQNRFDDFLERHDHSAEAQEIVKIEKNEIELYEQYKAFYSYGVYAARKVD